MKFITIFTIIIIISILLLYVFTTVNSLSIELFSNSNDFYNYKKKLINMGIPSNVIDLHMRKDLRQDGCLPYRLGDIVFSDYLGWDSLGPENVKEQYLKCHKNTIGAKYDKFKTKKFDIQTLANITKGEAK